MKIEINDQGVLVCPSCGNDCLHHEIVEIFQRHEDSENGVHVDSRADELKVDGNMAGNPSQRRHGINIHFMCENCDAKPILSISQHKGATIFEFDIFIPFCLA